MKRKRVETKDYKDALDSIKSLREPGHTTDEFAWGLLASYCEVTKTESCGLRVEIKLPGMSHEMSLEDADEEMFFNRTKKAVIEAVQHVLYCNELRIENFRRNGHRIYDSQPPLHKNRKFDKKRVEING